MTAHDQRILDEHTEHEARAIAENRDTPASNIRNGLQILTMASVVDGSGTRQLSATEYAAAYSRFKAAVDELEAITKAIPFHELVTRMREAWKCPDCGKCRKLFNANAMAMGHRRPTGYKAERPSLAIHCACPATEEREAGPAFCLTEVKR